MSYLLPPLLLPSSVFLLCPLLDEDVRTPFTPSPPRKPSTRTISSLKTQKPILATVSLFKHSPSTSRRPFLTMENSIRLPAESSTLAEETVFSAPGS
jgi:hypothetical protein